jgi:hypothetical protein
MSHRADPAVLALLAVAALCVAVALAGCAGGGPLGTGLGQVVATIKVTDASGKTCQVDVANGKDQTNLSLTDLSVCGGHLGSLHADRSDGAQAAIGANAAVANHAIDVGAGLAGAALTVAGVPHGSPKPAPPTPAPTVPAPLPPFPTPLESPEP